MKLLDTEEVYGVFNNTDVSEGRGEHYLQHVTRCESTARRLGKGQYVQAYDCPVVKIKRLKIQLDGEDRGQWYVAAIRVIPPTKEDEKEEVRLKEERIKKEMVERLRDKIQANKPLTEEEKANVLELLK